MASVRLFGSVFNAKPEEQLPNGDWHMIALEHTGRCAAGTRILVRKNEVMSMDAAEVPTAAASQKVIDDAMAAEAKTLTPIADLIAKAREAGTLVNPAPVTPNPQQRA